MQSGSTLADPNRFKFDANEFYLKTPAQMRQLFSDHPDACDNTLLIAERCNVEFDTTANYMPHFPVPAGESEDSWFVKEVERGLVERYPNGIPDAVRTQANYETQVINADGVPGLLPRSSPTSSAGRGRTASGSARAAVRAPVRWRRTR